MEIKCKYCGHHFSIADSDSTGDVKCPLCGGIYSAVDISSLKLTQAIHEPPPRKPFPTIGQAFILIVAMYVIVFLMSIPLGIYMAFAGVEKAPPVILESIFTLISFAIIIYFGFRKTREPFIDVFPLKSFNPVLLLPLFLAVAGATVILSDVDNLVRMVFPAPE